MDGRKPDTASDSYLIGAFAYQFIVTFVANKQLVDRFACISIDFLKPLFNVVERLLICDVVNHDDAMCAAIITEMSNFNQHY